MDSMVDMSEPLKSMSMLGPSVMNLKASTAFAVLLTWTSRRAVGSSGFSVKLYALKSAYLWISSGMVL